MTTATVSEIVRCLKFVFYGDLEAAIQYAERIAGMGGILSPDYAAAAAQLRQQASAKENAE